jgi:hypothetical protein
LFIVACLSFSYKSPIDHFEFSDPIDERAALGTVDVGAELEAQSLSQVVVLASDWFENSNRLRALVSELEAVSAQMAVKAEQWK